MTLINNSVQYGAIYYDNHDDTFTFADYSEPDEVKMIPVTFIPMILVAVITLIMYAAKLNVLLVFGCNIALCALVYLFYNKHKAQERKMLLKSCIKKSIYELTENQMLQIKDAVSAGLQLMYLSIKRYIWTLFFLPFLIFLAVILRQEKAAAAIFGSVLVWEIAISSLMEMNLARRKRLLKRIEAELDQ